MTTKIPTPLRRQLLSFSVRLIRSISLLFGMCQAQKVCRIVMQSNIPLLGFMKNFHSLGNDVDHITPTFLGIYADPTAYWHMLTPIGSSIQTSCILDFRHAFK